MLKTSLVSFKLRILKYHQHLEFKMENEYDYREHFICVNLRIFAVNTKVNDIRDRLSLKLKSILFLKYLCSENFNSICF